MHDTAIVLLCALHFGAKARRTDRLPLQAAMHRHSVHHLEQLTKRLQAQITSGTHMYSVQVDTAAVMLQGLCAHGHRASTDLGIIGAGLISSIARDQSVSLLTAAGWSV